MLLISCFVCSWLYASVDSAAVPADVRLGSPERTAACIGDTVRTPLALLNEQGTLGAGGAKRIRLRRQSTVRVTVSDNSANVRPTSPDDRIDALSVGRESAATARSARTVRSSIVGASDWAIYQGLVVKKDKELRRYLKRLMGGTAVSGTDVGGAEQQEDDLEVVVEASERLFGSAYYLEACRRIDEMMQKMRSFMEELRAQKKVEKDLVEQIKNYRTPWYKIEKLTAVNKEALEKKKRDQSVVVVEILDRLNALRLQDLNPQYTDLPSSLLGFYRAKGLELEDVDEDNVAEAMREVNATVKAVNLIVTDVRDACVMYARSLEQLGACFTTVGKECSQIGLQYQSPPRIPAPPSKPAFIEVISLSDSQQAVA